MAISGAVTALQMYVDIYNLHAHHLAFLTILALASIHYDTSTSYLGVPRGPTCRHICRCLLVEFQTSICRRAC